MTTNQLTARSIDEQKRANMAKEGENYRSNRAKENLERRSQDITKRGQNIKAVTDTLTGGMKVLGAINDPSWYNQNPQLVKDAAAVSFKTPLASKEVVSSGQEQEHPQVFRLAYYPTLPRGYSSGLGINGGYINKGVMQAAYTTYAWIRQANSGARNYEAVDLIQYCLAMESLYSTIAWGMRAYRVAQSFDSYNRNYDLALPKACGIDVGDWRTNLANARLYINTCVTKALSFNIPNTMSLFLRHMWMNTNVFKDSDIKRASLLVFHPRAYYTFDSGANALLKAHDFGEDLTFAQFKAIVDSMFSALNNDDDVSIISGDIRKAYGDSLFFLSELKEDEKVVPVYSPEVLSQINGAVMFGGLDDVDQLSTTQAGGNTIITSELTNTIKYTGVTLPNWNLHNENTGVKSPRVNILHEDVTPDDIMVATRLAATIGTRIESITGDNTSTNFVAYVRFCGTELISYCRGYLTDGTVVGEISRTNNVFRLNWNGTIYQISDANLSEMIDRPATMSVFDWMPYFALTAVVVNTSASPAVVDKTVHFAENGDREQYAYISEVQLANLHDVAAMAEFGVPYTGSAIRKTR